MTLLADNDRAEMLDHGAAAARGERRDPLPIVKVYAPDSGAVWLLTELDPEDGDTAFGLCDAGVGSPELGTISVAYLESMRGPKGYPVARDPTFRARFALSEYLKRSKVDGMVND